jgi:hypothetical protein
METRTIFGSDEPETIRYQPLKSVLGSARPRGNKKAARHEPSGLFLLGNLVAGARNHLKLRDITELCSMVEPLAAASKIGLFRAAA